VDNVLGDTIVQKQQVATPVQARRESTNSVLNFLAAYQLREASNNALLLSRINAKCTPSRPAQAYQLDVKSAQRFYGLDQSQIDHLATLTGNFDAMSSNAQDGPLGIKEFLLKSKGSTHVLISPCMSHVNRALRAYHTYKKHKPELTAVFLVPYTKRHINAFTQWTLLNVIPSDVNQHPMAAYTDFTAKENNPVIHFRVSDHLTMAVPATVSGSNSQVLLDTGASGTGFISKAYCQSQGIKMYTGNTVPVTLGNAMRIQANLFAHIQIRMGKFKSKIECLVLEDIPGIPVILGDPWLQTYKAKIDFELQQVQLTGNTNTVLIHSSLKPKQPKLKNPSAKSDPPTVLGSILPQGPLPEISVTTDIPNLISSKRLAKDIKKNKIEDIFLSLIKQVKDTISNENPIQPTLDGDDPFKQFIPGDSLPEKKMRILLQEYSDLYLKDSLPHYELLTHQRSVIPLVAGATIPIKPMRRYSPAEIEEMTKQVKNLLEHNLIQKSTSPFGANILFAKKKDGGLRMCTDYRGLNRITISNRFPLPRIDDLLDKLQGAKVFTALDLLAAYHQVKLLDDEIPRTAFRTPFGLFEWKVMPFGITNAPSVFSAMVMDILGDLPFVTVYLDDILIFSKNELEHVEHVSQVLQRLRQNKLFVKLSKCEFFKSQIQYLGHIVGQNGIAPDPNKIKAVAEWATPTTVFDVRSFLGFTNYFRRYINNYAEITLPLLELMGGNISRRKSANTPVFWKPHHQKAF